ncbi:hypothetical protein [Paenibacillus sp. GCM10027626]|uniref:hypothetical protein n=1 Tax=Paenibacillus sp. GCM10027626 TaxID=3273411 RepID=UPI003633557D
MKLLHLSAVCMLMFLSAIMTGFSSQDDPRRGTWLWQSSLIVTEPDQILSFAKEHGVNLLYLKIDPTKKASYYQPFIKRARAAGIEIEALGGKASWGLTENRSQIIELADWVIKYNQTVTNAETISGIHLDIEPYTLDAWKSDQQEDVIKQWMGNVTAYVDYIKRNSSLQVTCDIPFWLDKTPVPNDSNTSISKWLISKHDSVTVMAYRDHADGSNSISTLVPPVMTAADALGKKVLIGVETKKSNEGDFVTFYEEGKAYMEQELNKLPKLMSAYPSYNGVAVHSYEYWKNLRN